MHGNFALTLSRKQVLLLVLLFIMVIAIHFWGQNRLGLSTINSDQLYYKIFTAKTQNPELYQNDPVYGDTGNFQFYTPVFLQLIAPFFKTFGFLKTLLIWQPVLAFGYLSTCFVLLYRFSGRFETSLFVALLSGQAIPVFPVDQWGVYAIGHVMPRTVFLVFSPLLFYAWLTWQNQFKKLLGLFLLLGILTNLHPVSGITLALPMLLTQVFYHRFSQDTLKQVFLCGVTWLIPVLPFAFNYFGNTNEAFQGTPDNIALLLEALAYRMPSVTPRVFEVYGSLLLIPLGWWLITLWASLEIRQKLWPLPELFSLSILCILLGCYMINYMIIVPSGRLPSLIDLVRTSKFLMLPLLVLLAQWLASFTGKALWFRMGMMLILTTLLNGLALVQALTVNPLSWQKAGQSTEREFRHWLSKNGWRIHGDRAVEVEYFKQLNQLANWLKGHTPVKTTLIHVALPAPKTEDMMVRALSERSVTFSGKDGGLLYYSSKPLFLAWYQQARLLNKMHQTHGYCSVTEQHYAQEIQASHLLCLSGNKPLLLTISYQNDAFVLYRLGNPGETQ
jgi:hypothetical protein